METWWWIALCAVVLLAVLATLVDGAGRLSRGRDRNGPRARAATDARDVSRPEDRYKPPEAIDHTGQDAPHPGEIWTAALPHRVTETGVPEGAATTEGVCLVLAVGADAVRAVPVLGDGPPASGGPPARDGAEGPGIPGELDGLRRSDRLASDSVLTVPWADLRHRVGLVDPALWDQVRYLAD